MPPRPGAIRLGGGVTRLMGRLAWMSLRLPTFGDAPPGATGRVRVDRRTKNLTKRLRPGDIAVIDHEDIDRVSAEALVACRPSLIVNAGRLHHGPLSQRRAADSASRPGARDRCLRAGPDGQGHERGHDWVEDRGDAVRAGTPSWPPGGC
jgi:hypothetical protein